MTLNSSIPTYERSARIQFEECKFVLEILRPNTIAPVMIDVGAHLGSSLTAFAIAGWTIHAFEPDPQNRAGLLKRISKNPSRFENVTVYSDAVSDKAREDAAFFSSPLSTGISGLTAFHDSLSETGRVRTTTLNDFVDQKSLQRIDFLKIDVEGHEMSVLKGLDFSKIKPRVILAEFEDRKTKPTYSADELAKFLEGHGYTVLVSEWHPIEQYGIQHSWRQLRERPYIPSSDSWGNLIAFIDKPNGSEIQRAAKKSIARPISGIEKAAKHWVRQFLSIFERR